MRSAEQAVPPLARIPLALGRCGPCRRCRGEPMASCRRSGRGTGRRRSPRPDPPCRRSSCRRRPSRCGRRSRRATGAATGARRPGRPAAPHRGPPGRRRCRTGTAIARSRARPRAAPVRVATSMIASGSSSAARDSPSARTSRPSASVLRTSMVAPLRMVRTSPGLRAAPPGMFSVMGAMAVTRTGTPSSAQAAMAPSTIAAPLMSVFIVVIPSAVLSDSPPESKVMPLPTSTTWGSGRRSGSAGLVARRAPGGAAPMSPGSPRATRPAARRRCGPRPRPRPS